MAEISVLLVDDEEDFVTTLAERLQLRGFTVSFETDGEQALSLIEASDLNIVILDLMMPGLGGLEVLQRIKEINPQIPVILLTGHGDEKEGPQGMRLGAFDYLMKPLDIDELVEKIQEAVAGRKSINA
jgi:DNA-binding response OmpR family regulator